MYYIDHDVLYSDKNISADWTRLTNRAKFAQDSFWRKYARRRMRRTAKQLLRGVRPRI